MSAINAELPKSVITKLQAIYKSSTSWNTEGQLLDDPW